MPVVVRAPLWMRLVGPVLLAGVWVAMLTPIGLAVRERDWMAPVGDSGLGAGGAIVGWVIVAVFVVIIPPSLKVLLTYRTVLDAQGVQAPNSRGRVDLEEIKTVRWVPQGGPVNAANRPERFEVLSESSGLVARVSRDEADWPAVRAMLRHWAQRRPEIVRDDQTAAALAADANDVDGMPDSGHHRD